MTHILRWMTPVLLTAMIFGPPAFCKPTTRSVRHKPSRLDHALIQAVLTNNDAAAIRLLNRGANPNALVTKMLSVPPSDFVLASDAVPGSLLTNAIRNADVKITKALIAHGANVTKRDASGATAFGLAVGYGQLSVIDALLKKGVNVNAPESNETALHTAVYSNNNNAKVVRLLLKYGADVNAQENPNHETALIYAAGTPRSEGQSEIVRALLKAHPALELKDVSGYTALRIAEAAGNSDIVRLFRNAGAKEISLFPPILFEKAAYAITDLGLGCANAINNRGDVAGVISGGKNDFDELLPGRAFVWSKGSLQILQKLNGPSSVAISMNDEGQVVGEADFSRPDASSSYTRHACLWQEGVIQDLHPRTGWASEEIGSGSEAVSISNGGLVAEAVDLHFFLWKNGHWQDLQTDSLRKKHIPAGAAIWEEAAPIAMNNKRQVIPHLIASGTERAGLWDGGKLRELPPPRVNLESTSGGRIWVVENFTASAINDKSGIVGQTVGGDPVCWSDGKITLLPRLYHYGSIKFPMNTCGINNQGQIVGSVSEIRPARHPEKHAVLWQGGKVSDLNAFIFDGSGWMLEEARGINEAGQIVGRGTYHGKEHAFLLTPLASDVDQN